MDNQKRTDPTEAGRTATFTPAQTPTPSVQAGPARPSSRKRKWLRLAVICLAGMVAAGIGLRLVLPALLVAVGNNRCASLLACPAKLQAVRLAMLDYRVTVQGLTVDQPDGFGGGLFLDLPEANVKLVVASLFGSPLIVDEVAVVDATLHIVRDRAGNVNVVRLLRPAEGKPEAVAGKPIHIKRITVKNLTVQYTDFSLSEEPVDVTVKQTDAVITDVHVDPARSGEHLLPGRGEMTAHIVQRGFADAPLGIIARFGCLDPEQPIPAANAAIRLAGLELQPWSAFVPRGVSQAIGGDIMDVNADVALAAELLDCTVAIVTPAGDALSLKVGGTPRQPRVEAGGIRGMVGGRAMEAGLNGLQNVAGTGGALGRTAISSTVAVGKGAGKTVWGLVTGLFTTGTSVSKGNISDAGADLWNTASAGATNAADMVGNAGVSLAAGAAKTGAATTGGDYARVWRADIQRRWVQSWEEACASIEQGAFPLPSSRPVREMVGGPPNADR